MRKKFLYETANELRKDGHSTEEIAEKMSIRLWRAKDLLRYADIVAANEEKNGEKLYRRVADLANEGYSIKEISKIVDRGMTRTRAAYHTAIRRGYAKHKASAYASIRSWKVPLGSIVQVVEGLPYEDGVRLVRIIPRRGDGTIADAILILLKKALRESVTPEGTPEGGKLGAEDGDAGEP